MELSPLVQDFIRHIDLERNLSHHTVEQYTRDLRRWVRYLEENEVELDTDRVDVHHVRSFVRELSSSGLSPRTVIRVLACLRSFYTFVCRFHGVPQNPAAAVPSPKFQQRLPEVLTHSEVARLIEACSDNYFRLYRTRDKAILAILACLGLRRQELMDLTLDDWDADQRTLRVRSGKGGRERLLPVTGELIALVKAWRAVRPATSEPYLFVSRHGGRVTSDSLQRLLRRLSDSAGLKRRPHLHMFRHYAATAIVNNHTSGGLEQARRILGHLSHSTVAVYSHLSVDDLRPVVSDTAALAGLSRQRADDTVDARLDPGTELASARLRELLGTLGNEWQRDSRATAWIVTEWARQCVPDDGRALGFSETEDILHNRRTVAGLGLDAHLAVAEFGHAASRRLASRRPQTVESLLEIGEELGRGLAGREAMGEGVAASELAGLNRLLPRRGTGVDPATVLSAVARVAYHLRDVRVDVPCGRTAIEMLLGLLSWERGLPPLVIPLADRSLWALLLDRLAGGDAVPAVAYAVARAAGVAGELTVRLAGTAHRGDDPLQH